jgi:hypothetical protein
MNARKSTELFVTTEDAPGELARVLGLVAGAGVNILAYVGWGEGARGQIMLITENNRKVGTVLEKAGYDTDEATVVLVTDRDMVGSGAAIAEAAARAGVNLRSAFATCTGSEYLTVLLADEPSKLVAALNRPKPRPRKRARP